MRAALCFASLQILLHSRYIPRYRPNSSPGQLRVASLQTSLHSRCIPRYTPNPSPDPAFRRSLACVELPQSSWSCGGALCVLRFALPRYRPLQTSLHSHYIPRCAALHCATDTACQEMLSVPLQSCVTRISVTDLRNKIRGASRVTDP